MRLENPDKSAEASEALDFLQQLARERGIEVKALTEHDATKGDLIVSLAIEIGAALASSVVYDLLKLGAQRIIQRNAKASSKVIEIDGTKKSLGELS